MLDSLKEKVEAELIFFFIEPFENPFAIQVLKNKVEVLKKNNIKFNIYDLSINEYKTYECKVFYENKIKSSSITVYYNRRNYYFCGNGNHSAEIIFLIL